jgi:hypothetical protein
VSTTVQGDNKRALIVSLKLQVFSWYVKFCQVFPTITLVENGHFAIGPLQLVPAINF